MSYKITLIPGDGIGPEVTDAMRVCVDALGLGIEWEVALAGEPALEKHSELLPEETLNTIKKNKVAIKGPITTPVGKGFRSINVALRQRLDLYSCVRPSVTFEGTKTFYKDIDLVIIRENSEDLYAGVEFSHEDPFTAELIESINKKSEKKARVGSAISIKPISEFGSKRIVKFAFELARREGRKSVGCVHKANIMKFTDGLFLKVFREVAADYPEIESYDIIVDNLSMQLVMKPQNFDVLVLPNLYGDIVSDLCAGLIGGLGMAPGANIGEGCAIFEPVHGSAPKYAGKNKANPTATILSAVMMLKYLGEVEKAKILEASVASIIKENKDVTYDLKPTKDDSTAVGTKEMAEAIAARVKEQIK